MAKKIDNKVFSFNRECKENGELYGSIKPKEIVNLINEKSDVGVTASQIVLKDNLNKLGLFVLTINFHAEVTAKISLKIDKIQS